MYRILLPMLLPLSWGFFYWLGARRRTDWRSQRLREHAKYLRRARWAVLTRRDGLVNIYMEAARDVLELEQSDE